MCSTLGGVAPYQALVWDSTQCLRFNIQWIVLIYWIVSYFNMYFQKIFSNSGWSRPLGIWHPATPLGWDSTKCPRSWVQLIVLIFLPVSLFGIYCRRYFGSIMRWGIVIFCFVFWVHPKGGHLIKKTRLFSRPSPPPIPKTNKKVDSFSPFFRGVTWIWNDFLKI